MPKSSEEIKLEADIFNLENELKKLKDTPSSSIDSEVLEANMKTLQETIDEKKLALQVLVTKLNAEK